MANGNLITQSQKMYESELDTTDYANLLAQPAVDAMKTGLAIARTKTEALIASMPAGVNISKVPEELRGTVTDYLTENKAAYVEASKVIASGMRPTDPRYIEAMETMNRIRGGFESLDANLTKLVENRKLSLDNRDNISKGASDGSKFIHEKFANGDIYKEITLEDGNFFYTDAQGNRVNTNDYKMAFGTSGAITESMQGIHDNAIDMKYKGNKFNEGRYRGIIRTNLNKAGKDGRVDFAYSGMYGDESGQTEFIDKYISEKHGVTEESDPAEFKRLYESYKEADFSAGTELGDKLEEYLLGSVESSYNNAKTAQTKNSGSGGFENPFIYGAKRSKKDIDDMNEALKNRQGTVIGFNNEQYVYNPTTDKYEMGGDSYSADDVRIRQKIHGYKAGEDPAVDMEQRKAVAEEQRQEEIRIKRENLNLTTYFPDDNSGDEEDAVAALHEAYPDHKHLIYSPTSPREKIIVDEEEFYLRGCLDGSCTAASEMERLQNKLNDLQ
tara:strand:- start:3261 stop:4757 length:1497 start_codon:yes stop_codon:yes gene_type:complete